MDMNPLLINQINAERLREAERQAARWQLVCNARANARPLWRRIWEQMLPRNRYQQKVRARIKEYASR